MRGQISYFMPTLVRMREWKLLFTISKDGVSFNTFYRNTRDRDNTVLIMKDDTGRTFGAYLCEEWHPSKYFYGLGESFVFSFDAKAVITVSRYSGSNEKIQFSDQKCIIIGGGSATSQRTEAALYIAHEFVGGHSGESETFFNPVLSGSRDFKIVDFEVWGFDSI